MDILSSSQHNSHSRFYEKSRSHLHKDNTVVITLHPDRSRHKNEYIKPTQGISMSEELNWAHSLLKQFHSTPTLGHINYCTWAFADADRTLVSAPVVLLGVIHNLNGRISLDSTSKSFTKLYTKNQIETLNCLVQTLFQIDFPNMKQEKRLFFLNNFSPELKLRESTYFENSSLTLQSMFMSNERQTVISDIKSTLHSLHKAQDSNSLPMLAIQARLQADDILTIVVFLFDLDRNCPTLLDELKNIYDNMTFDSAFTKDCTELSDSIFDIISYIHMLSLVSFCLKDLVLADCTKPEELVAAMVLEKLVRKINSYTSITPSSTSLESTDHETIDTNSDGLDTPIYDQFLFDEDMHTSTDSLKRSSVKVSSSLSEHTTSLDQETFVDDKTDDEEGLQFSFDEDLEQIETNAQLNISSSQQLLATDTSQNFPLFRIQPLFETAHSIRNSTSFFSHLLTWPSFTRLEQIDVFLAKSDSSKNCGASVYHLSRVAKESLAKLSSEHGLHLNIQDGTGSSAERGNIFTSGFKYNSITRNLNSKNSLNHYSETWQPASIENRMRTLEKQSKLLTQNSFIPQLNMSPDHARFMTNIINKGIQAHHHFFRSKDNILLNWIKSDECVARSLKAVLDIKLGSRFSETNIDESFSFNQLRAIRANAVFRRLGIPHTSLISLNESFKDVDKSLIKTLYANYGWFQSYIHEHIIGLISWNPSLFESLNMPEDLHHYLQDSFNHVSSIIKDISGLHIHEFFPQEKLKAKQIRTTILNKELELRNTYINLAKKDEDLLNELDKQLLEFMTLELSVLKEETPDTWRSLTTQCLNHESFYEKLQTLLLIGLSWDYPSKSIFG